MLSNIDIACFANDWNADPTSKHHLLRRFSETNRVLWVESAGMRAPNLARADDLKRLVTKAKGFLRTSRRVTDNLHVYAPPAIPLPGSAAARAANGLLYRHTIARELRRIGMAPDPLLWVFAPHVAPNLRGMRRRALVYHCVDRWSAFKGYDPEVMARAERELCEEADVVLASATDLVERCAQYTSNVHYVPHGVDHAHFAAALADGPVPEDVRGLTGPLVGFFGLIHEWVDIDLIGALADRLPYTFVLIGATDQDLGALLARRNVVHLGRRQYAELPAYCRAFQAAIVPFRTTALTQSVNPIKLREYAAAGLPVVSTALPEVRRCADIAACVTTADEWEAALRIAVERGAQPAERAAQSSRVLGDDWWAIAERVSGHIADALRKRGHAAPVSAPRHAQAVAS